MAGTGVTIFFIGGIGALAVTVTYERIWDAGYIIITVKVDRFIALHITISLTNLDIR